jgi:hypothetical protein
LAATHILQGIERLAGPDAVLPDEAHPIEIFARACGVYP